MSSVSPFIQSSYIFNRILIFFHSSVLYVHWKVDPQIRYSSATIVNDTLFSRLVLQV